MHIISNILILHMLYTTTASNVTSCRTISTLPLQKSLICNESITIGPVTWNEEGDIYTVFYNVTLSREIFYICDFYDCNSIDNCLDKCINNVPNCLNDDDSDSDCRFCFPRSKSYSYTVSKGKSYVQFAVMSNTGGDMKVKSSCCLHFSIEEGTNDTLYYSQTIRDSVTEPSPSQESSLVIIFIVIMSFTICCIGCIIVFGTHICLRKRTDPITTTPATTSTPLEPIALVTHQVCEDIPILFIYASNSSSFKKIVRILQNIIQSTEKLSVIDPYNELDSIGCDGPFKWLQTHALRKNLKVLLFLNQQIINYMETDEANYNNDTSEKLIKIFFQIICPKLFEGQVIRVCIAESIFTPQGNINGSRQYVLPSHFDDLVKDLGVCNNDETIITKGKNLKRYCDKYVEEERAQSL